MCGLAVVAVLLEEGPSPPNPALQFALSLAPEASHEQQTADQQPMQLESLLPQQQANGHRPYIHYVGSLTTPPCSEDVQWFVFADTVAVPGSQVHQFQQYADKANPGLRANARPLQPINNRTVDYADFLGTVLAARPLKEQICQHQQAVCGIRGHERFSLWPGTPVDLCGLPPPSPPTPTEIN
ncbi:hypothetical protein WJX79_005356 [Trebouxia sp. C0005]